MSVFKELAKSFYFDYNAEDFDELNLDKQVELAVAWFREADSCTQAECIIESSAFSDCAADLVLPGYQTDALQKIIKGSLSYMLKCAGNEYNQLMATIDW